MKKLAILTLLVAAFAVLSLGSTRAANETLTVTLTALNGSGEAGTATITKVSDADIKVTVNLTGGGAAMSAPQPAHIHKGTCAQLDPKPAYPLNNVVSGKSDTQVMVNMADLTAAPYAVNVHKSAAEAGVYVSCGDIKAMSTGGSTTGSMTGGTMPASGNGELLLIAGVLLLAALLLTGTGMVLRRTRA